MLPAQKLAVMETAFGNRGAVESIALTKKAGFQGVQIHPGKIDATLDQIGYGKWLVCEARGGIKNGDTKLSEENLKGMKKLVALQNK